MLKRQKRFLAIFFSFTVLLATSTGQSYAGGIVTFGPHETQIEGSIKYSVIGRYVAHFNSFKGRINLDVKSQRIQSVYLDIEAGSIQSNHPWCDKIARSRRLLYTARYPKIIFKSDEIIQDESGYKVKGVLEMRGIKRRLIFPFKVEILIDQKAKRKLLDLKGNWNINRKDFNIIWNKYLDHGGVLVSDIFTVNWGIKILIPDTHSSSVLMPDTHSSS
jgi:polyisoprenoid-binding protein YceI